MHQVCGRVLVAMQHLVVFPRPLQNLKKLLQRALFSGPIQHHRTLPCSPSAIEAVLETVNMGWEAERDDLMKRIGTRMGKVNKARRRAPGNGWPWTLCTEGFWWMDDTTWATNAPRKLMST